jgi:hypothetical protein
MKKTLFAATAALALTVSTQASASVIELGLGIDGSGSISGSNFVLQRDAYADVLADLIPTDGSVAVGVWQFATNFQLEFATTLIASQSDLDGVGAQIGQRGGRADSRDGFRVQRRPACSGARMPYKANAPRRHKFPKARYRINNWPAYDAALVDRGDLTVWVTPEALAAWHPLPSGQRGRSFTYSDRLWCTNRRCGHADRGAGDVRRPQLTRRETGMPRRVIRLITAQPIRASAFCPGRLRARRRRPINVL